MKDSKTYQANLAKFWKPSKSKENASKPVYENPVDAIVYSAIKERFNESTTAKMVKKIYSHFVDLNDLRVSRQEEIIDILGGSEPEHKEVADTLTVVLNSLFDKNDCLNLDELKLEGKRKIKEELEKLKGMTSFMISYVMLVCFDGHSIPLNKNMIDFFVKNEILDADEPIEKMQGFLERQVPAVCGYDFFCHFLLESEGGKKTKTKTKTAAKAKKVKKK